LVDGIATDETGEIDLEELTSTFKNDNKDLNSNTISNFYEGYFPMLHVNLSAQIMIGLKENLCIKG
jgi:hypothetical protein